MRVYSVFGILCALREMGGNDKHFQLFSGDMTTTIYYLWFALRALGSMRRRQSSWELDHERIVNLSSSYADRSHVVSMLIAKYEL